MFGIMKFLELPDKLSMKTFLLLALLGALIYYHSLSKPNASDTAVKPGASVVAKEIVVAPAPFYRDRWKTACTDLKTGPNAQVTFEPFLPNEQANWNQSRGFTMVSGPWIRRH
jgi:hypothetical protein